MTTEAFPLQWPTGRIRTSRWCRERAKFDVSFARAQNNIIHEVDLLTDGRWGPEAHTVISTNIALRRDGLPLANQRAPEDVGVAVYFVYKKKQMSFACDRWDKIEHNMQAIAKTIEALRGIARWGTGDMLEAAFTGFMALPAPSVKTWREVLGVSFAGDMSTDDLKSYYRRAASAAHPDKHDNDGQAMVAVNLAYEQAKQELGLT